MFCASPSHTINTLTYLTKRLFCESGGPDNQGEEVLHLPVIVESAESSPAAAQVAAQQIRKFLSKENYARPHVQYNSIMLIRILADNPGATFTRNLDQKFTSTVKELLRTGKDPNVQQILRETLQALYLEKAYDTNLATLFSMWSKESGMNISQSARAGGSGQNGGFGRQHGGHPQVPRTNSHNKQRDLVLPPPVELAARIEEAKTSAKLLQQLVQSTPPGELQNHELIKEFGERCQNAQRSVQAFMNSTNPSPDDDTMQTLIETSEQLSLAASKHQRAVLQARKSGHTASPLQAQNGYTPPTGPPPSQNTGYSSPTAAPSSTFTPTAVHDLQAYSPPPIPPSMRNNLQRRSTAENNLAMASQPPSLKPSGPPPVPSTKQPPQLPPVSTDDNPFSDTHESFAPPRGPPPGKRSSIEPISASSYGEDDDPYRNPSSHPDPSNNSGASSTIANLTSRPAPPRGPAESWRDPAPGQSQSYHPGFSSTPSYMHRQESSGDHLTMHGAGSDPAIAEERVVESAGRYGRVSPVAEREARTASLGDVSPVESRYGAPGNGASAGPPGYRY
jgi:hypothetical protein